MIPTGRFTRKIARQPTVPISRPPTVGPTLIPTETTVPMMPSARPRSERGKRFGDEAHPQRLDHHRARALNHAEADQHADRRSHPAQHATPW